jgi:hypothetical protein
MDRLSVCFCICLLKNRILLLDLRAKAGWVFFARMIQFGCLMQAQLPGVVVFKEAAFQATLHQPFSIHRCFFIFMFYRSVNTIIDGFLSHTQDY